MSILNQTFCSVAPQTPTSDCQGKRPEATTHCTNWKNQSKAHEARCFEKKASAEKAPMIVS